MFCKAPNVQVPESVTEYLCIIDLCYEIEPLGNISHFATLQSALEICDTFCEQREHSAVLSPLIANDISSLALLSQYSRQIQLFHPLKTAQSHYKGLPESEVEKLVADYAVLESIEKCFSCWLPYAVCRQALAITTMDYPVHKRRTQETVEAMRFTEDALDSLWSQIVVA